MEAVGIPKTVADYKTARRHTQKTVLIASVMWTSAVIVYQD
jgi:hypothetical protein